MKVGYVVLYVKNVDVCRAFWVNQVGMVERKRSTLGPFSVVQVGFADQPFSFELVPLEMMKDNPDGLDLATPSICFHAEDLESTRARMVAQGVPATEVTEHHGVRNFAFSDPEGRWFAVTP